MNELKYLDGDRLWACADIPDIISDAIGKLKANQGWEDSPQHRLRLKNDWSSCEYGAVLCLSKSLELFLVKAGIYSVEESMDTAEKLRPRAPSLRATASIMCATTGRLLALMDGGALTAIKCSVLAGTILELYSSRKTPRITIYGAGEVAKSIIRGVLSVTKVESITIICRSKNSFDRIKADITSFYPDVFFSFEEFMQNDNRATDADIVFTATSSDKNVIMKAENFRRAELICCMGQYSSDNREFDDSFLNSTRSIIVDDCEVAITMAGLDNCHLVSLQADVRLQRIEKLPRQVLFFSVGSASWDMLVVSHLLKSISFEC